jgi:putative Holliday junction resolvase
MIVGIDPGERRVGVAVADDETRFARPLEVVDRAATDAIGRIVEIAADVGADVIVVGRPVGLSGRAGPAVAAQEEFVAELKARSEIDVLEYDERFTTVVAERAMRAAGVPAGPRRGLRDAVAAQVMLQDFLDAGR